MTRRLSGSLFVIVNKYMSVSSIGYVVVKCTIPLAVMVGCPMVYTGGGQHESTLKRVRGCIRELVRMVGQNRFE